MCLSKGYLRLLHVLPVLSLYVGCSTALSLENGKYLHINMGFQERAYFSFLIAPSYECRNYFRQAVEPQRLILS